MQAVKFGKQVGGGVGCRAQRVLWVLLLPRSEVLVSLPELQVVHVTVAGVQRRRRSEAGGVGTDGCKGARQRHQDQRDRNISLPEHQTPIARRARPSASAQKALEVCTVSITSRTAVT